MRYLFLIFLLIPSIVFSADVRLTFEWLPNTEPDLAGYKLYDSQTPGGPYTIVKQVGVVTTTDDLISINIGETVYYVLTAYDTEGNESGYSNEVNFFLPASGPNVPPNPPGLYLRGWAVVTSR